MINGFMKIIQGNIRICGKRAAITDKLFFLKTNVKNNIIFYNKNISEEYIETVSKELGITEELKTTGGLNTSMEDLRLFSKSLMQRVAIARVLCSGANMYTLDRPLENL
jgi:ABC-type transport system involved in cytochrome bd biosynthesis fused ATPase/permease subunit